MLTPQCKFCTDGFHHCGSYQFNLHQRGIAQGELCDVHYWEVKACTAEARVAELEAAVSEFAHHDSWRCSYYQKCHCDLDATTDKLGLPRIPYPPQ